MYMTRVMLKRVPQPNIIHGVLSAAFPGKRSDRANENLWRVDALGDGSALIIVSAGKPDLRRIIGEIGIGDEKRDKILDYEPFLARIERGQAWNFRLCANPVKHKNENPAGERGKVYALGSVPEQLAWLGRQGAKYGFNVNGCYIIGDEWRVFKETDKNGEKNSVRIRAVTFDGLLTVTDAEAFRAALTNGIGRGKAYGCGLLTIARVQI